MNGVEVGLRRCGHRAPARARLAGRHRRHPGHRHRRGGQRGGRRAQGRRRRHRRHARARGCRRHQLRHDGRRPDVRLRQHHRRRSTTTSTRSCPVTPTWSTTATSPVQDWVDEGRQVTKRPVVSAGQYGAALNQIVFDVDPGTGEVLAKRQAVLQAEGRQRRSVQLPGRRGHPGDRRRGGGERRTSSVPSRSARSPDRFRRAKFDNGTSENRGGESTLGNLVAEVQRWATRNPESGSAQIAFMNPGGLRQDMVGASPARRCTRRRSPTGRPPTSSRSPTPW